MGRGLACPSPPAHVLQMGKGAPTGLPEAGGGEGSGAVAAGLLPALRAVALLNSLSLSTEPRSLVQGC